MPLRPAQAVHNQTLRVEKRKELRADVKYLGKVLGRIIAQENSKVYQVVENLRLLAKDFRAGSNKEAFNKMVQQAKELSATESKGVARSFSHFLALSNCAETHHRVREMDEMRRQVQFGKEASAFPPTEDSCRGAIHSLMEVEKLSPRELRKALLDQRVELVLTAHPTEINRRTTIEKHRRVVRALAASDIMDRIEASNAKDASEQQQQQQQVEREGESETYERRELTDSVRREVASLYFSDELRRFKPTPLHEAQGGLAVFESVLWNAVPSYLRKLDKELTMQLTQRGLPAAEAGLPLDAAPVRFASWIGGDRDGNPNVTPETTLRVSAMNRGLAATLHARDLGELYDELSMSKGFSEEVRMIAEQVGGVDDGELYRQILSHLRDRLQATARRCQQLERCSLTELAHAMSADEEEDADDGDQLRAHSRHHKRRRQMPLRRVADLMDPLMAIHRSLVSSGLSEIANGRLADSIRRVAVFGLTIMPLDIRQESGRHLEVMDAITRHLGIGSYAQWSEESKINWLCNELASPHRPLLAHRALSGDKFADVSSLKTLGFTDTVVDTLQTFRAASMLGEGALGAYVISQAKATSDVLAVALLQQEFGMVDLPSSCGEGGNAAPRRDSLGRPMMRVVPLFETLDDLNNAPAVIERLLRLPAYLGRIGGRCEIMVGYSDSAKDAGRLAACWAQYRCQEELAAVAKRVGGIELTFFHGKGGTVGRGGSPAVYRAVLSHPPNTIAGRFRITEQGEMISQNFGHQSIAERTLDVYTAAVLREKHYTTTMPTPEWRRAMDRLSARSCEHYRNLVRQDPAFVPYFRAVTPEQQLSGLNIGSRPAKRNPKGGVESLRAIPWIFAWSQTRANLPAWLGVSKGLQDPEIQSTLADMYAKWPWFRELCDLIAMILSKSDETIVANYDQLIPHGADSSQLVALGERIRADLQASRSAVLQVSGQEDTYMSNKVLKREMEVRNPYLDSLNVIQCEVMRRLQRHEYANEEERQQLNDALLITINGLAQGLKNTG